MEAWIAGNRSGEAFRNFRLVSATADPAEREIHAVVRISRHFAVRNGRGGKEKDEGGMMKDEWLAKQGLKVTVRLRFRFAVTGQSSLRSAHESVVGIA